MRELQEEISDLNLNVCFVFEGEEECDSEGFDQVVQTHQDWFQGTELILIMNTYWIGDHPSLTYGLRGVLELEIEISGPEKDLHSGVDGGVSHEPFHQMVHLLNDIVDGSGNVRIPGTFEFQT